MKRFVPPAREVAVDSGEPTATLKLKRKQICEQYKETVEGLYVQADESVNDRPITDQGEEQ